MYQKKSNQTEEQAKDQSAIELRVLGSKQYQDLIERLSSRVKQSGDLPVGDEKRLALGFGPLHGVGLGIQRHDFKGIKECLGKCETKEAAEFLDELGGIEQDCIEAHATFKAKPPAPMKTAPVTIKVPENHKGIPSFANLDGEIVELPVATSKRSAIMTARVKDKTGKSSNNDELSEAERTRLLELENNLKRNTYSVMRALSEIRCKRLYRENHKTFEAYCASRLSIGKRRAYQLCDAEETFTLLMETPEIEVKPVNENQVRAFVDKWDVLTPEMTKSVWSNAVKSSKSGMPTGKDVKKALSEAIPMDKSPSGTYKAASKPEDVQESIKIKVSDLAEMIENLTDKKLLARLSKEYDNEAISALVAMRLEELGEECEK